ncbi:ABC transporter ATP-binding protein [Halorubrum amylolyticum]|uniref:ABC transporter ATP-binding protein n=1 Tax=Halorubrum amylolyticum TaxID=2508724 RepID=UPI00100876D4|nr:ABC transporter ATP-binding protein [Halorubrum amylolyticum]
MSNLSFNDVTKRYGDVVAVQDLDIDIEDGEFIVIVGPSGCGKTTTLRMVAGFEEISEGEISIKNEVINNQRPQERDIAMVFQSYALYPHMTVKENIGFGLRHSTDFSSEAIETKVVETAEMLGIGGLLDRKPEDLSGGQQQRVALGRAIIRDPDVFLMDEPLSNLDAKLRAQMRTELQHIQGQLDVTTLYVTHNQTEAMTMGDRIIILDGGKLQQFGTPMECYHKPNNQFVAGFIGEPSMNFVALSRESGTLARENFRYELTDEMVGSISATPEITLGIRPENVDVLPEPEEPNDFFATVDVVEPFGKEHNLYLDPVDAEFSQPIIATITGRQRFEEGDRIGVRFPPDYVHLFDGQTGNAIWNPSDNEESVPSSTI